MTVTQGRVADASVKAATLIEALPWLNRFHGQTVVIKYGGHAMADEALRLAFAQDLVFLRYAGLRPVVVHGGGPQITEHLGRLGVESAFTAGLRVTTPEAMVVVRMVLSGKVNKDIVGLINRHGPFAVGMSGEDASTFTATRKMAIVDGEPVDIGLVGEIVATNPGAIEALLPVLEAGMIPKMEACLTAVRGGVQQAHVLDGRLSHAVLLEIFTDSGIGTMVTPGAPPPPPPPPPPPHPPPPRFPEARDEPDRSPAETVRSGAHAELRRAPAGHQPGAGLPGMGRRR